MLLTYIKLHKVTKNTYYIETQSLKYIFKRRVTVTCMILYVKSQDLVTESIIYYNFSF